MLLSSSGLDVIQALFANQGIEGEGAHHLPAFSERSYVVAKTNNFELSQPYKDDASGKECDMLVESIRPLITLMSSDSAHTAAATGYE